MNRTYHLVWNEETQSRVPAPESARGRGKSCGRTLKPTVLLLAAAFAAPAFAQTTPPAPTTLPTGGQVVAGQAGIAQSGAAMTVSQGSARAIINWQGFDIGSQASVRFQQPSSSAVALNRVIAGDASQIHGQLSANGQVWLVNPAGIVFGAGSRVDVGGLVASTLDSTNEDFMAGKAVFSRNGATGGIENHGEITAADGGLVALLAPTVKNEGIVRARLGTVAFAAGERIALEAGADGLLHVALDPATVRTLIENKQLIVADGGQVIMTSKAADALAAGVVANPGTVQARTVAERAGRILLLADMAHGEVIHSGLLDASAPEGGDGGFVETSAATVTLGGAAQITTLAANGHTGEWLIDPNDYTIAARGGNITGAQLSNNLKQNNVTISTATQGTTGGNGDIFVNDAVSWNANKLTLVAERDVNINAVMTAGGSASLDLEPGSQKVNVGISSDAKGFKGRIDFPDRSGTGFLTINGADYIVINGLGMHSGTGTTSLQGMRNNPSGNYALGSNIDAGATRGWNDKAGFTPVGSFTGTFYGLGHTVSNLTIDRPETDSVGLFGRIDNAGTVRNLALDARVTGKGAVGVLAGINHGTIANSIMIGGEVNGSEADVGGLVGINKGSLTSSHAAVRVKGSGNNIGGLVGLNDQGAISSSHATGEVSGNDSVGGLIGSNHGDVTSSYATGQVDGHNLVGGLMGYNQAFILSSHATGGVRGHNSVGGLVGVSWGNVTSSYATGEVLGAYGVGGLVGVNQSASITSSYATGAVGAGVGFRNLQIAPYGSSEAGGLVGVNRGSIIASYATGDVDGFKPVIGGGYRIGGLVGRNNGSITSSHASGKVNGTDEIGGLVGTNAGTITSSHATGAVRSTGLLTTGLVGGLVGVNEYGATIDNSHYNIDAVVINGETGVVTRGGLYHGQYQNWIKNNKTLDVTDYFGAPVEGYYQIGTLQGLKNLLGFAENPAYKFRLSGDIDLVSGFYIPYLAGEIDGGGHVISRLELSRPASENFLSWSAAANDLGLFGVIDKNGIVRNLGVKHASVNGGTNIGALAGLNLGTIINSYVKDGRVNGSGDINATGNNVGGLVGLSRGTITDSYVSDARVDGSRDNIGGLVGLNEGTISSSHATGEVRGHDSVGGLVGGNHGGVTSSHASVRVDGHDSVGGLAGWNVASISSSHAAGEVRGNDSVGGLVGWNAASISSSHASGAVNGHDSVGGLVGTNWKGHIKVRYVEGSIMSSYATGRVGGGGLFNGGNFIGGLVGRNESGITSSYATGAVSGDRDHVGGLAGWNQGSVTSSHATGEVKGGNLTSGSNFVGGLIGHNEGKIASSHATGKVGGNRDHVGGLVGINTSAGAIASSHATGDVTAGDAVVGGTFIGGLVGRNEGSITISYATGKVGAARNHVGGLVGWNEGSVASSYATGEVNGGNFLSGGNALGGLVGHNEGKITSSYATGKIISHRGSVGGLVGENWGAVASSFWDRDSTGRDKGVGKNEDAFTAAGLSTAQAMQLSSYNGWDFANTWYMVDGHTRPFLRSEHSTTITNAHQLQLMGMDLGASYTLAAHIGLPAWTPAGMWSARGFVPIGTPAKPFTGTLEGARYSVSGLSIMNHMSDHQGLFGVIGKGGAVRNLLLNGGSVFGQTAVGALAGKNLGTVSDISMAGTRVSGIESVGGLVGWNQGAIINSQANGLVSGLGSKIGPVVGHNNGTLTDGWLPAAPPQAGAPKPATDSGAPVGADLLRAAEVARTSAPPPRPEAGPAPDVGGSPVLPFLALAPDFIRIGSGEEQE